MSELENSVFKHTIEGMEEMNPIVTTVTARTLYNTPVSVMWQEVRRMCRNTVGKGDLSSEVSYAFRQSQMNKLHSPIRELRFVLEFKNLPSDVSQQFSRHIIACNDHGFNIKEQINPVDGDDYVSTCRSDRTILKRKDINRETPVNHSISANAQGLVDMSRKRLCFMAQKEARKAWELAVEAIEEIEPIMAKAMVKECVRSRYCGEDCAYKGSQAQQDEILIFGVNFE